MTIKNFVIVHTSSGRRYAERISNSIRWINEHRYPQHDFYISTWSVTEISSLAEAGFLQEGPERTIIYSRAAYPRKSGWMRYLFSLKERGFTVINDPEVLYLTSNKLECSLRLQDHFPHPRTWLINKNVDMDRYRVFGRACDEGYEHFIVKPETSISQGANVLKFDSEDIDGYGDLDNFVERVPGNIVVLQERVPYSAIYRVIVIGGHALPYSFVDRPTTEKWKVSVCLNRETMEFVDNPSPDLLRLAENIQQFIGGEINFIDIFEITPNSFVVSEINTACNLHIHEMLAKRTGHPKWNIHYRIAKYLVERSL